MSYVYDVNDLQIHIPTVLSQRLHIQPAHSILVNIHINTQQPTDNIQATSTLINLYRVIRLIEYIIHHYPIQSFNDIPLILSTALCYIITHTSICALNNHQSPSLFDDVSVCIGISHPSNHHKLSHQCTAHELNISTESPQWGKVTILHEYTNDSINPTSGLYILHISPQQSIPTHVHHIMNETEMICSSVMDVQSVNNQVQFGTIHSWKHNIPHTYINTSTTSECCILCIDIPKFIPSDEILVSDSASIDTLHNIIPYDQSQSIHHNTICTFPGAYHNQTVTLYLNASAQHQPGDVLIYIFNTDYTKLLLVNHNTRGLELCGGKVESNESITAACVREIYEESGYKINENRLYYIGQYEIYGNERTVRYKSIYTCTVQPNQPHTTQLQNETNHIEWLDLHNTHILIDAIHSSSDANPYSTLLRDNVFPLCLQHIRSIQHTFIKYNAI